MTMIKELFYLLTVRIPTTVMGRLKGNLIHVHWSRIGKNFGDCLSPIILKHYGFTPVFCTNHNKSDVVVAGTLLQWLERDYAGYVVGAGADEGVYDFGKAKVLAVRGALTRANLKVDTAPVMGDPGLLMPLIYNGAREKKWEVGIVPHFVDFNHPFIGKMMAKYNGKCKRIDVLRDPKAVIDDITACRYILSSSLHGLIVADAYGIPNARIVIRETMPTSRYDYKFNDYYSIFQYEHTPVEITDETEMESLVSKCELQNRQKVQRKIAELDALFAEFRKRFKN